MKLTPKDLAKIIVEYVEKNEIKGKQRDRVAHAMSYAAVMVAQAEGDKQAFTGICYITGIRGYSNVVEMATRADEPEEPQAKTA